MTVIVVLSETSHHSRKIVPVLKELPGADVQVVRKWQNAGKAGTYDLVIVDVSVEEVTSVIPMIRQSCGHAKVLGLMTFGFPHSEHEYVALGADDVLRMPFTPHRLRITVQNLLRLAHAEKQIQAFQDTSA